MLAPNQIRARLLEQDIKVMDVARRFRVSPTTVSVIINGWGKSKRIQEWIAEQLGMAYAAVWGRNNHRKAA